MAQMRLLKDALSAVKEQDENTALTTHAIRQLAVSGRISSVMIGRRRLINIDSLFKFLETGCSEEPGQVGRMQKIRMVR